jgi:hypothetical protein
MGLSATLLSQDFVQLLEIHWLYEMMMEATCNGQALVLLLPPAGNSYH